MDRLLEATAAAERDHFWFRGFRRFVSPLLAAAAAGRTALSILDCGCGTGFNLQLLTPYGRAVGIDLTWTGLRVARARGERGIAQASATHLPFADASFDLVTSFDVLVALDDAAEDEALREMFRVLRPGGKLVVNVAAMEFLKGNHSILAREVRRYSRPTLRAALRRVGFRVDRLTYTNASILPALAVVRLAQRASGHEESAGEIAVPSPPVNAALSAVLAAEAAVVRLMDMPFGSSLLALAEKPS